MITFIMHVYKDLDLADKNINKLKILNPISEVFVITDGCNYYNKLANCYECTRLKTINHGGGWTQRWLYFLLHESKSNNFIKLDPDTNVHKPIQHIPNAHAFGIPIMPKDGNWYIHGAAMGLNRVTAKVILNSEFLNDNKYVTDFYAMPRFKGKFLKEGEIEEDKLISSQDRILGDVLKRLNILPTLWPEVYVAKRFDTKIVLPNNHPFTFTHPNTAFI